MEKLVSNNEKKPTSPAVIRRMPRYYRYLGDLMNSGVERISSKTLSEKMHVTASQIRQDLNNFGGFGQQGYGYNVKYLHDEIGKILGLDREHNVIVIGCGNIGQAVANYRNFYGLGFNMVGFFDNNPNLKGKKINGIPIKMVDELDEFVKETRVDICALTLPKDVAKPMAEKVLALGIKAIWNFAPVDLNLPPDVIVENVHLSESLMRLSYAIANNKE
jgi:redox-sensing transcriptional repressor